MHFGAEGAKASPAHIPFLFKICLLVVFLHLNGVKDQKYADIDFCRVIKMILIGNEWFFIEIDISGAFHTQFNCWFLVSFNLIKYL